MKVFKTSLYQSFSDSLKKVFYHLYFNAFRLGSEMAIRQDNAADINTRFDIDLDSIPAESEGRLEVFNLKQDGPC